MVVDKDAACAAVSVIICAYTELRWEQTRAALASVLAQCPAPAEVLLVVDHNAGLSERARAELSRSVPGQSAGGQAMLDRVRILDSDGPPGLSGARNCGMRAASQPITAFLDDDAQARPGWLAALVEPYSRADVVATGGGVHPRWPRTRPGWLPPAFDWVVGCSYLGLPDSMSVIRNPIGANMSMRTDLALAVGGFDRAVGRVGRRPSGCEETELAIRLTASRPGRVVMYVPSAAVDHHVSADRIKLGYFLRRCWHEGRSKAEVVRLAGATSGLERERRQVAAVIPAALLRDMRDVARGRLGAISRICAALGGVAAATTGYLAQRGRQALRRVRRPGARGAVPIAQPSSYSDRTDA